MAMHLHEGSARIYEFPKRGRFAVGGARQEAKAGADAASTRPAKAVVGSGWYHEAAIQEAERAARR